jgi:hypothetical protein
MALTHRLLTFQEIQKEKRLAYEALAGISERYQPEDLVAAQEGRA